MMSNTGCWILILVSGSLVLHGLAKMENLWCLQCTRDSVNDYSKKNCSGNSTVNDLCDHYDLSTIRLESKMSKRLTPIVNPLCTYYKSSYRDILPGPCYNSSCYAGSAKSCIKWTVYQNGILLNETRLCARSNVNQGCYQKDDDGFLTEVCVCSDQNFCNGHWSTTRSSWSSDCYRILTVVLLISAQYISFT